MRYAPNLSVMLLLGVLSCTAAADETHTAPAQENGAAVTDIQKREMTSAEKKFAEGFNLFLNIANVARQATYATNNDDPAAEEARFDAAIKAYINAIDPHSTYLTGKEYDAKREARKGGQFGGLGMEVALDDTTGAVRVVAPIDGTPAEKAGIQTGDFIIGVDKTLPEGVEDAVGKMRGTPGTQVHLTVSRKGNTEPLEFDLTREIIKTNPVKSAMIGDIGYIRLATFNHEEASAKVEEAVKKLKDENKNVKIDGVIQDIKGYVVDVRNNPGGLLDQGEKIADLFLNAGLVDTLKAKDGQTTHSFEAHDGDITDGKPIIVLANGGSASASEIFAGALQGNDRAKVLGEKTFGKGSAQIDIPLSKLSGDPNLKGALWLTTHLYFLPDGKGGERSIQGKGVTPNIEYREPQSQGYRNMLKEAAMKGVIANPMKDKVDKGDGITESFCAAANGIDDKVGATDLYASLVSKDGKPDYQLICAVEKLGGSATPPAEFPASMFSGDSEKLTVITPKASVAPALTQ